MVEKKALPKKAGTTKRTTSAKKPASTRKPAAGDARKSRGISPKRQAPSVHRKAATKSTKRKPTKRKKKVTQHGWWRRWVFNRRMMGRLMSIGLTLLIIGCMVILYFAHDLPNISNLQTIKKQPGITLQTKSGIILNSYGDVYGEYLHYDEIPEPMVQALLATEDRRFFYHYGVDPVGIARAMLVNARAGRFVQGGSTITQQLAKNVFLTPERTIKRKIQEMLLSIWLEGRYTKEEIIAIYLNRMYLGAGHYGIDAASNRYFGHSARSLNRIEAATLAGLLKAPSKYSPTSNPELAKKRAHTVLLSMADAGYMQEDNVKEWLAKFTPPKTYREDKASGSRYFTDWLVDQIPEYIGRIEGDITVITTLDPERQKQAELSVEKILSENGEEKNASQGALVSMKPDGAVVAMVGGRDYFTSQYNRAVQAERQPGSTFKLFVYLAALEAGVTPDMLVVDQELEIPVGRRIWRPKNFSHQYQGEITVRDGFKGSINTIAVQLAMAVGPDKVAQLAERMGMKKIDPNPSIALGAVQSNLIDITAGYAHVANNGRGVIPYGIEKIVSKEGDVLFERQSSGLWVVLRPSIVAMANDLLTNVVAGGTGGRASIGRPVAGKTGTSQDYRDAWFVGFTPQLVTGVWTGNDNNKAMKRVTGGNLPAMIFREYMSQAMAGLPVRGFSTAAQDSSLPWNGESGSLEGLDIRMPASDLTQSFWDKLFADENEERTLPENAPFGVQNNNDRAYPSQREYRVRR